MQALHFTVREGAEMKGSKRGAHLLQQAVKGGGFERYRHYASLVNERPPAALRDLLAIRPAAGAGPLSLDEVRRRHIMALLDRGHEPRVAVPEAHETRHAQPGRRPVELWRGRRGPGPLRTERSSAIKQVASGRFGRGVPGPRRRAQIKILGPGRRGR